MSPSPVSASRTNGFTLVELLVSLGIIALLVGLLVPGVQSARSSARRISCMNQARQIGLALHYYHESHLTFPPGSFVMGPSFSIQSGWGWGAMLMPFLEQKAVYDRVDFGQLTAVAPNLSVITTSLSIWQCPAEIAHGHVSVVPLHHPPLNLPSGNFCGAEGVLSCMSSVRLSDISDGPSQTLLLGERMIQAGNDATLRFVSTWFGQLAYPDGYEYRCVPHLQPTADNPINDSPFNVQTFGSRHAGGANFIFADGAGRFLSQTLDGRLYAALGTAQGGEVTSEF